MDYARCTTKYLVAACSWQWTDSCNPQATSYQLCILEFRNAARMARSIRKRSPEKYSDGFEGLLS